MSKITLESILTELPDGWKILSNEYTNLQTEMEFECPKGHRVYSPWNKLRARPVCQICEQQIIDNDVSIIPKPKGVQRILALDQASHTTGYAIFDSTTLVKYGKFNTTKETEILRFADIQQWLLSMIKNWRPDVIAFEDIQLQEATTQRMGVTVFQTLAQLQGVCMITAYNAGIRYHICPTNTWRHANGVQGKSRQDKKRSMQLIVQQRHGIDVTDDEADAIGIGYYYSHEITANTSRASFRIEE